MKVFFTGDLHFGHENIIKLDSRPFKSVEEMDAELIHRWNNKVAPGDLVYVLGDMIWKTRNDDAIKILKELNGQIYLFKGNHDKFLHNAKVKKLLAGIKEHDSISITLENGEKKTCFLSHYFTPMYPGHFRGAIHLHAHSHKTSEAVEEVKYAKYLNEKGFTNQIYNVGCMYWDFEPVTLDEILKTKAGGR